MPSELPLSFAQVEQLIATRHRIPAHRMSALRARLKHFKRLGFPSGVNTGRGRPAEYGASQIVFLLVAFDMLQLGLTPERIVRLLQDHGYAVAASAKEAALNLLEDAPPAHKDALLCLDPIGAIGLSAPETQDEADDPAARTLFYRSAGDVARMIAERGMPHERLAMINVTLMLGDAAIFLSMAEILPHDVLLKATIEWASSREWETTDVNSEA